MTTVLRLTALGLMAGALLAGCEAMKGGKEPVEPVDLPPAQCNSFTTGSVVLGIAGNPNDSFRIIMTCNNQVVARCTATIAAGAAAARCTDGPNAPVPNGPLSCRVGPGNANSPAARVVTKGCG